MYCRPLDGERLRCDYTEYLHILAGTYVNLNSNISIIGKNCVKEEHSLLFYTEILCF